MHLLCRQRNIFLFNLFLFGEPIRQTYAFVWCVVGRPIRLADIKSLFYVTIKCLAIFGACM